VHRSITSKLPFSLRPAQQAVQSPIRSDESGKETHRLLALTADGDNVPDPLTIEAIVRGGQQGLASFCNGTIDEMEWYIRAVTPTELTARFMTGGRRNAATDFMPPPSVIRQGVCKAGTYNIDDKLPFPTTGDASNFLGRITLRLQGTITMNCDCSECFNGTLGAYQDTYDFNPSNRADT
jgi:hypothetical protein